MFNDAQKKIIDAIVEFRRGVYERYDQAVTDWYYDSDTKHLSFPTCIHGTDLWTDYDNICPECENGEGVWDEDRERTAAEDKVKRAVYYTRKRLDLDIPGQVAEARPAYHWPSGEDVALIRAWANWVHEPVNKLRKKFGLEDSYHLGYIPPAPTPEPVPDLPVF